MASEQTTFRLFEKIDEIISNQSDIRERLARVEEKQDAHYVENDNSHNQMNGIMVELKDRVDSLEAETDDQQTELDTQRGKRQILSKGLEYVVMLLSGGLLVAIGGWLAKMLGILR